MPRTNLPTFSDDPARESVRMGPVSQELADRPRRRLAPGGEDRASALETAWTVLVIALILLLTYWIESSLGAASGGEGPSSLDFQPTPQAVSLGMAARSLQPVGLRLAESLPFPLTSAGFSAAGQGYVSGQGDGWLYVCILEGLIQGVQAEYLNPSLEEVAVSPDLTLLVTGTHSGEVVVWELSDPGPPRRIFTLANHPGRIRALRFSPAGGRLAVGTGEGTWLWQIADQARRERILPGRDVDRIAFSPSGAWLASLEYGDEIWVRSLEDGRVVQRFTGFASPDHEILFDKDDRLVIAERQEVGLQLWRAASSPDTSGVAAEFAPWVFLPLGAEAARSASLAIAPGGGDLLVGTRSGAVLTALWQARGAVPDPQEIYFERLGFDTFDSNQVSEIDPGCSQAAWKRSLLNHNLIALAQSAPPAGEPPGGSPAEGAVFLGRHLRRPLVASLVFGLDGGPAGGVFLVIHEPEAEPSADIRFDFEDRKVGQRAEIETLHIEGISVEIVRGSWRYAIIDSPEFSGGQVQPESVTWIASWEPDTGRQTLRWEDGGRLFELILLPSPDGPAEPVVSVRERLLELTREIIRASRAAP